MTGGNAGDLALLQEIENLKQTVAELITQINTPASDLCVVSGDTTIFTNTPHSYRRIYMRRSDYDHLVGGVNGGDFYCIFIASTGKAWTGFLDGTKITTKAPTWTALN